MAVEVGQVYTFDYQSDVFRGEYRITGSLGDRTFTAEYVEPSDRVIDEATEYYLVSENPYLDYVDPFGPGRRRATRQESLDMEIMSRIDRAGTTFKIRIVSADEYAAAF